MYPVMLQLEGRRCLVVGGGGVALRKVQGLVAEGARVTVVARDVVEPLAELARSGRLTLKVRPYREGEAAGYALVFAATDRSEVNRRVHEDAERAGVWINAADIPDLCSFHLPARVQRGALQVAVASGGEAPFAVRRLRQLLERRFGPEWGEWQAAAARFRSRVRRLGLEPETRERAFDKFFDSTVDGERLTARVPSEAEENSWTTRFATLSSRRSTPAGPGELDRQRHSGFVSLVGAGPGAPAC